MSSEIWNDFYDEMVQEFYKKIFIDVRLKSTALGNYNLSQLHFLKYIQYTTYIYKKITLPLICLFFHQNLLYSTNPKWHIRSQAK